MTEKEGQNIQQRIALLNLRFNDFVQELNNTIKKLVEDNNTLQKENTELKTQKKEKTK